MVLFVPDASFHSKSTTDCLVVADGHALLVVAQRLSECARVHTHTHTHTHTHMVNRTVKHFAFKAKARRNTTCFTAQSLGHRLVIVCSVSNLRPILHVRPPGGRMSGSLSPSSTSCMGRGEDFSGIKQSRGIEPCRGMETFLCCIKNSHSNP